MPDPASGCAVAVVVFNLDDYEMWVCKIGATKWSNHRYGISTFRKGASPQTLNIAECNGFSATGGKIYFEVAADELGVVKFTRKQGLELTL